MDNLLFTAPDGAIPEVNSPAYLLPKSLYDNGKSLRDYLCNELGGGFRDYFQQLMGEYYQHWLIHSEQGEYNGKKQALYWFDERHFFCDWEQKKDARATATARKHYKDRSYSGSKSVVMRLQIAEQEKAEPDKADKQRIESKKPTEC
jgi:hypothetical protein